VDHPSLIPALLLADSSEDPDSDGPSPLGPVPRSARDWVVDVSLVVLAVAFGTLVVTNTEIHPVPAPQPLLVVDVASGVLGCLALLWRRRWPVGIALLLAAIATYSDMVSGAVLIALFTVAVHRPLRILLIVTGANLASFAVYVVVRPGADGPQAMVIIVGLVLTAAVVAWGLFVRARRQLVHELRGRAVRAESEQRLRVEQARQLERTRIAREMHDVLAHRLSLLSMHAGALEFRPDAPPAEVARAAGVIRASARAALEDLRQVIGLLRDTAGAASSDRPQPTLADLPALVAESRQAGLRVHEEYSVPNLDAAPDITGRTAYRVVQEGLTNVRKHAPGAVVSVRVRADADGLDVEIVNPPRVGAMHDETLPSAGTGLIGLRERVGLAGGVLDDGWTATGEFRLHARLPWPGGAAAELRPVGARLC
jgi:signal transduction histidine kinase